MLFRAVKQWFEDMPPSHAWAGNGVVLAVTTFDMEKALKVLLLLASLTLTVLTIYWKWKKNRED